MSPIPLTLTKCYFQQQFIVASVQHMLPAEGKRKGQQFSPCSSWRGLQIQNQLGETVYQNEDIVSRSSLQRLVQRPPNTVLYRPLYTVDTVATTHGRQRCTLTLQQRLTGNLCTLVDATTIWHADTGINTAGTDLRIRYEVEQKTFQYCIKLLLL